MSENTKTDLPTKRAMDAAFDMEVHAACSTQTIAKALSLDRHFPAYDKLLAALRWFIDDIDGEHTNMVDFDQNVAAARAAIADASSEVSR